LAVTGVITYRQQQTFLINRVDEQLSFATRPMYTALLENDFGFPGGGGHGGSGLAYGTYGELRDSDGAVIATGVRVIEPGRTSLNPPDLPSALTAADERYFGAHAPHGGTHYRVLITHLDSAPGDASTLVVAIPLPDFDQTLHYLLFVVLLVAGAVVLA